MNDLRKIKRYSNRHDLKVYDESSNNLIGQVMNLSIGGLGIIGSTHIGSNEIFRVSISLPNSITAGKQVSCLIKNIHSTLASDRPLFLSGFKINLISDQDNETVRELINEDLWHDAMGYDRLFTPNTYFYNMADSHH